MSELSAIDLLHGVLIDSKVDRTPMLDRTSRRITFWPKPWHELVIVYTCTNYNSICDKPSERVKICLEKPTGPGLLDDGCKQMNWVMEVGEDVKASLPEMIAIMIDSNPDPDEDAEVEPAVDRMTLMSNIKLDFYAAACNLVLVVIMSLAIITEIETARLLMILAASLVATTVVALGVRVGLNLRMFMRGGA